MKILLCAVGKLRDAGLSRLCDDYLNRTRRHLPVDVIEADDCAGLLRKIPTGAEVIALEPDGEAWTTAMFTKFIDDRMVRGTKAVAFLIGGADGLSAEAVARADRRLSLTALTLPHRLARLILCEQIYRALSILRNEPYNR